MACPSPGKCLAARAAWYANQCCRGDSRIARQSRTGISPVARIRSLTAGKCLAARVAFRRSRGECEPAMQTPRLALPGEILLCKYQREVRESRLRREYPRPSSGERAPRPSGGVCEPARRAYGSTRRVRFLVRVTNTKAPMRLHRCFCIGEPTSN